MTLSVDQITSIRSGLEAILSSRELKRSKDAKAVLRAMVELHLEGICGPVKLPEIAERAELPAHFHAGDTNRVGDAIKKLREKLPRYYTRERADAVWFEIPMQTDPGGPQKGDGYLLVVHWRAEGVPERAGDRSEVVGLKTPPAQGAVDATPEPPPARSPVSPDVAVPQVAVRTTTHSDEWSNWIKRHMYELALAAAVLALLALYAPSLFRPREGFVKLGERGVVGSTEWVEGSGPRTPLNRYLVVAVDDQLYIQSKLTGDPWRIFTHFGDLDTEPGTKFTIFVLVTAETVDAPTARANVLPDSQQYFSTIVTLKK